MILINNEDVRKTKKIYVEWIDSSATRGWTHKTDIEQENVGNLKICSIGYLLRDEKDFITITTSISVNSSAMDPLSIPTCAITKRRIFK